MVWRTDSIDPDVAPVDHYVVWSTASPTDRTVEPIVVADVSNLLWIMEPGEEPWGYQQIAPDGTLVSYDSLVGLPGE